MSYTTALMQITSVYGTTTCCTVLLTIQNTTIIGHCKSVIIILRSELYLLPVQCILHVQYHQTNANEHVVFKVPIPMLDHIDLARAQDTFHSPATKAYTWSIGG